MSAAQQQQPDECAICLEPKQKGDTLITTPCDHVFHLACLAMQATSSPLSTCPLCRGEIDQVRTIYQKKQASSASSAPVSPSVPSPPVPSPSPFPMGPYGQAPVGYPSPGGYGQIPMGNVANPGQTPPGMYRQSCPASSRVEIDYGVNDEVDQDAIAVSVKMSTNDVEIAPLSCSVAVERDAFVCGESGEMFGAVSVQAPKMETVQSGAKAPLDIVMVIDNSGSMHGDKIELVKHTLKFMLSKLGPADRLSVVQFDNRAEVVFPLKRTTEETKVALVAQVNSIGARGGTDIALGLTTGIEMLVRRKQRNAITSLMLLTDGQDSSTLNKVESVMSKLPAGTSVHCFGFGKDHDARVLSAISESVHGTFTYVEHAETVGPAFAATLGGLVSVAAVDIQVTIQIGDAAAAEGYRLAKVHTAFEHTMAGDKKSATVTLADLFAEEKRDCVFTLSVPATAENLDGALVVGGSVLYSKPGAGQQTVDAAPATLLRPVKLTGEATFNIAVVAQRCRVRCSEALDLASTLAEAKDLPAAREALAGAIAEIEASVAAQEHMCIELVRDLKTTKERLVDVKAYSSSNGYGALRHAANQHHMQRQTWTSAANNIAQPATSAYGYNACQTNYVQGYGALPHNY